MLPQLILVGAAVAAAVAALGAFAPQLFLHVPEVGFVLWSLAGQHLPGYFDTTAFDQSEKIFRKNDVVVMSGTKTGTNWAMTIAHELRTWNLTHLREFEDIGHIIPWVEFSYYPMQTFEDRMRMWGKPDNQDLWSSPLYPYRVFKTHFLPRPRPGEIVSEQAAPESKVPVLEFPDVKFISVVRSSEDVLCSFLHFLRMHTDGFRKMWGGFPPPAANMDEIVKLFHPVETILVVEHAVRLWSFRNESNLLLLHYEDLLKDTRAGVVQVMKFLGLDLPEENIDEVTKRVDIKFMKERNHLYLYQCGHNYEHTILKNVSGSLIREGGLDNCKDVLTAEHLRIWKQHVIDVAKNDTEFLKWYYNGGNLYA